MNYAERLRISYRIENMVKDLQQTAFDKAREACNKPGFEEDEVWGIARKAANEALKKYTEQLDQCIPAQEQSLKRFYMATYSEVFSRMQSRIVDDLRERIKSNLGSSSDQKPGPFDIKA